MSLKVKISTSKPKDIEYSLKVLRKEVEGKSKGLIDCRWKKIEDGKYLLDIGYLTFGTGKIVDWTVLRKLRKASKKIDPDIKIEKLKD